MNNRRDEWPSVRSVFENLDGWSGVLPGGGDIATYAAEELFPRMGFIVSNMSRTPENVVRFYNKRATAEQYIKKGKHALTWTRLSCAKYVSNRVRLALFVLAYNLGNFMRRFALPSEISHWSLSSIQLKLIKIEAKIISHSRMIVFQMAEVAVPERLFRSMLSRIHRLDRACARAPALSL